MGVRTDKKLFCLVGRGVIIDPEMLGERINVKISVLSLTVGGAFALLPVLPVLLPSAPFDSVQPLFGFLSLPGLIVAVVLVGGRVHDYSLPVVIAVNVLVYSLTVYVGLRWWRKHHARLEMD